MFWVAITWEEVTLTVCFQAMVLFAGVVVDLCLFSENTALQLHYFASWSLSYL